MLKSASCIMTWLQTHWLFRKAMEKLNTKMNSYKNLTLISTLKFSSRYLFQSFMTILNQIVKRNTRLLISGDVLENEIIAYVSIESGSFFKNDVYIWTLFFV